MCGGADGRCRCVAAGGPGQQLCAKHQASSMVSLFARTCAHPGCSKSPRFGERQQPETTSRCFHVSSSEAVSPGYRFGRTLRACVCLRGEGARPGASLVQRGNLMLDVWEPQRQARSDFLQHAPPRGRRQCVRHALPVRASDLALASSRARPRVCELTPGLLLERSFPEGCSKRASFGPARSSTAEHTNSSDSVGVMLFCKTHALPSHVNLNSPMCRTPGCARVASFGRYETDSLRGDKVRRVAAACKEHKDAGDVPVRTRFCNAPGGCVADTAALFSQSCGTCAHDGDTSVPLGGHAP
jgi:hypothetical protein